MHLKAIKPTKYLTRRLLPGDVFEVDDSRGGNLMAKILLATRKAVKHREPGRIAPPPVELAAKIAAPETDELAELRAEYQAKIGKRPFHRWDADTLRQKIAEIE